MVQWFERMKNIEKKKIARKKQPKRKSTKKQTAILQMCWN